MKVIFTDAAPAYLWERLPQLGFVCEDHSQTPREAVLDLLPNYAGAVVRSRLAIDREWLDRAKQLRFVARIGVGTEHIDLEYAEQVGIRVLTSPEGSRDTVGEHTVGMILGLLNHLPRADRQVRQGQWIRAGNRGTEIKGKTVGIIGYGNMGTSLARRLQGFDCEVIAYDKFKTGYGDRYAAAVDLATLQARAQIVSLHIPYTKDNHYFVDGAFLDAFAHPIWLINTARGLVLDTDALVERLRNGRVLGAALDVIEYEEQSFNYLDPLRQPPAFQYLLQADNVLLSPHIAGWSHEAEEKHARVLVEKIEQLDLVIKL